MGGTMISFAWPALTFCLLARLTAAEIPAPVKESGPLSTTEPVAVLKASVDKRIQEILPAAKEKRFDEIGWAGGIGEAERLAKEANRPVFLFSNVGQLDIGRC